MDNVIGADDRLTGILNVMMSEARAGNPAGQLFSQSLSLALMAYVFAAFDRRRVRQRLRGRLSAAQVAMVTRYVQEHIGSPLSLSELAGVLDLSPAYFCRAFSKAVGVTPHRFVLNERINASKIRLQESSETHDEIAMALGFASRSHFSSVFRRLVGCPPSAFGRNRRWDR